MAKSSCRRCDGLLERGYCMIGKKEEFEASERKDVVAE